MQDSQWSEGALAAALAGDAASLRAFVAALTPVVHARVARCLMKRGARTNRNLRQEIEDFTQEVFVALFDEDGRALRAWDPGRGLSLVNFVGLVAEHQVASILRSGRRNPWSDEPMVDTEIEAASGGACETEGRVHSREMLGILYERVRAELTPRGLHLFQRLIVEEGSVQSVCAETGLSADAAYTWRSRLGKMVRRFADDMTKDPIPNHAPHPPAAMAVRP